MRFTTLGSGSSGNATLIEHDGCALLIDCGLSVRELERRASAVDFDLAGLDAVLLTHEHADHVAGAAALARRLGVALHASRGTCLAAADTLGDVAEVLSFTPEKALAIGPFAIMPVIVPHDAREPCQFVVRAGGRGLGVLTDLGQPTRHLEAHFGGLDALVLEFNHEPALLDASAYPRVVRQRIAGRYGHLSNAQAADLLARLVHGGLGRLVAAHLSERTNTPERVWAHLERVLPAHVARTVAAADRPLPWCEV